MPNNLINETSPYLLQHAHNPVEWNPWGEEALARAREEDKPILLSIGYAACHWCHVMESESFENPDIAALMNQNFVCIKVDREERPDLDSIYMNAVQALTGSGGWPMTVFLTPDGKPFFGGTYYPPVDRGGMIGFPNLITRVAEAYKTRRGDILETTQQVLSQIQTLSQTTPSQDPLGVDILHLAYVGLGRSFDYENGGFGGPPKFPPAMTLEFLLQYHHMTKEPMVLDMIEMTAEKMARGGVYDQIGGGFHRYSTDAHWLVPHFEKMLYDNALLSRMYLHTYQATERPWYRRIVEETLDYVLREMTDPLGGFYSTQDADSEGEEGKFFLWTLEEITAVLGSEEGPLIAAYLGATDAGNFEGRNILNLPEGIESFAKEADVSVEQLVTALQRAKTSLREAREERVHPARDEKILSAWNGLMIRSFAEAASVFNNDDYRQAAIRSASFVLDALRKDGRLLRTYRDGQAKLNGYLEDYAFMAHGLLALYEATFDHRWLEEAHNLADQMLDLFWDEDEKVFYDTGKDHEALVVRPRDLFDNATPSGSSVATDVLLHLSVLTGDNDYSVKAATNLRSMQQTLSRVPQGMGYWLSALGFYVSIPKEIVIVGDGSSPDTQALKDVVFQGYIPHKVVVGSDPGMTVGTSVAMPLLEDRGMMDGRATAYVCQNYMCQLPVTDPDALAQQLQNQPPSPL